MGVQKIEQYQQKGQHLKFYPSRSGCTSVTQSCTRSDELDKFFIAERKLPKLHTVRDDTSDKAL